jgi:hypothetical protein
MNRVLPLAFAILFCVLVSACGDDPPPTTPTTPTRIIALTGDLTFGSINVGSSRDLNFSIANNGTDTLTVTGLTAPGGGVFTANWTSGAVAPGGVQIVTVKFSPQTAQSYNGTLTVNANHTSGTNTMPISGTGSQTGPRTQFGPGQYLVNTEIVAGRYYSNPASGCYWERESGLGGSLGEIIANDFISDNYGQAIVDILSTDLAFQTDLECGTWFKDSPRRGLEANISPGIWLVGPQVNPGVYRANVMSGCYWERLRGFTHRGVDDIIANDFIGTAGQQLVEVRSTDVGFQSNASCGIWTPATAFTAPVTPVQSSAEIDANRAAARAQRGVR